MNGQKHGMEVHRWANDVVFEIPWMNGELVDQNRVREIRRWFPARCPCATRCRRGLHSRCPAAASSRGRVPHLRSEPIPRPRRTALHAGHTLPATRQKCSSDVHLGARERVRVTGRAWPRHGRAVLAAPRLRALKYTVSENARAVRSSAATI